VRASARGLPARYLAFLEAIVLCLSVRIRGYDDLNFHIPSAAFTLHLQSREIVSASLAGLGSHAARWGKAFLQNYLTSLGTDAWNSFRTSIYLR
jgi:hypothetical protein